MDMLKIVPQLTDLSLIFTDFHSVEQGITLRLRDVF